MNRRVFWVYILVFVIVVGLLIAGVVMFLPKHEVVVVNRDNKEEIVVDRADGKIVNTVNVAGKVVGWNYDLVQLRLEVDGKIDTYTIDPLKTKVWLGKSQNNSNDPSMFLLDGNTHPMHWQQAFCPDDMVTLFVDSSNTIAWIIDVSARSCGFKEPIK